MSESKPPATPPKKGRLQIQVDDQIAQGSYVNMSLVNHTETEFIMDFVFIQPMESRAKVRSRIISNPKHAKRFLMALQDNIAKYEERFGIIELATHAPDKESFH
jgi:hypothetical protein